MIGFFIKKIINRISRKYTLADNSIYAAFLTAIANSVSVLLVTLGFTIGLSILHFPPSYSDIAQTTKEIILVLGIGSLAIALAAQDTLKHFIGSFVIAGDKPFEIGDRVVVDGHDGPVESIGLRSTCIRTLEGHLVTIPNGELANRTIQNIGKRPYIRRLANVTVPTTQPPKKSRKASK